MLHNKWIRYPSGDEMMLAIRCWRPVSDLTAEDVDGFDYLDLHEDGTYELQFHNRFTQGTWTTYRERMSLRFGDSLLETWSYEVKKDRLYTGG